MQRLNSLEPRRTARYPIRQEQSCFRRLHVGTANTLDLARTMVVADNAGPF